MIIAVDFDNTLAVTEYPTIIKPIRKTVDFCKRHKSMGDTLILWTCRHGLDLEKAVEWCKLQGIEFDYINENTAEGIRLWGDTRKIYADLYLDDRNIVLSQL